MVGILVDVWSIQVSQNQGILEDLLTIEHSPGINRFGDFQLGIGPKVCLNFFKARWIICLHWFHPAKTCRSQHIYHIAT